MQTSISLSLTPNLFSSLSTNTKTQENCIIRHCTSQSQPGHSSLKLGQPKTGQFSSGLRASVSVCGKGNYEATELEKKLADEMDTMEEDEWILGAAESCRNGDGIVELMECLKREASMGEDQGKEPMDYNRRAHIFDKSSRVFQALKASLVK